METPLPARPVALIGGNNLVNGGEPQILGEYRLLRRLGEGGMGSVYLGYHLPTETQVAIKVLSPHLAGDRKYVDRFYREARFGAALSHLNIVRTKSAQRDSTTGLNYMVLEYVDGPSCQFLLDRTGPLAVADAVHIALVMAQALQHMHGRRLVHRDIKPDNILITTSGVAKLADFGLVKRLDDAGELTAMQTTAFGTSWYMPFEQTRNASFVDGRSDIFALGATLYHLLTGVVPFDGENHAEVTSKKDLGEFVPASALNASVPKALDQILARMLARDPRKRFPTAGKLVRTLEQSELAAPILSFINIDLAMQDPDMRDRIVSNSQPTRPDLELTPPPGNAKPADDWQVRFHDAQGRLLVRTVSTGEILDGLRNGIWPDDAEAARAGKHLYRPLRVYPQFRGDPPATTPRPDTVETSAVPQPTTPESPSVSKPRRRRWEIMWCAGITIGTIVASAVTLFTSWRNLE